MMLNHQELVKEIARELYEEENVLALILFGSVSRHEEKSNSDIDLLAVKTEMRFQARTVVRNGIAVEFHEMHEDFLKHFIEIKEFSISSIIAEGIVLFDKTPVIEPLIDKAKKVVENHSFVNKEWENERYSIRKRFELTDMYKDLLDIDDEVSFNYAISLLIANIMPMIYEKLNSRPQSRKKAVTRLKSVNSEVFRYCNILLSAAYPLPEKREAAKELIGFVLKEHGGILAGDFVLFQVDKIEDL